MTDSPRRRFLMMAGGTGGHVFPALATARALQQRGHEVHWLGASGGMEERLIGDTDIPLSLIHISGLRGKGKLALLLAPFRLMRALGEAYTHLRRIRPDCVVGMGGFVTGPGGIAAWLMRKPLVIHEQNAIAGMTNRWLTRFSETVLEAFPDSFGDQTVTRCTGNPVRGEVASMDAPEQRLAGRSGRLRVLVIGGSLGAQVFNQQLPRALALMPEADRPDVRHQCGEKNLEAARAAYDEAGVSASIEPFIRDMAEAYGWADLVICRAGALTVSELCAAGIGAVLVPFPHAVDDHQTRNGQHMVKAGAAILVPQPKLNPEVLAETLKDLATDRKRILTMAKAARSLARPDATERVVNYCLEAANG
ncbi:MULTISPECIES: undecaprenyldiphospho-muramoylpentapeptide beta-N-acetylglucosaminyltransferase [Marinobacter]|jgi:UDP-N-acetylglucosamine--N-acetylmuramyl-(pentapeptide) pyrophosphoryl-undecaprenol N-acetylglucosamine transferase|uniref:undecaprenyldiphospho-muramoylpentapeptide beta-N-acetylglucosaminyltransferase n=1 Tax=Marinobacter TaxID=2742 RepID=UPI000256E9C9|nr:MULTISPECIES: undecaprenyldiphospho-muramoylpentapeptide beta-N-acetylglucosaminyltransferase [Marinobacter]ERS08225.1 UDP-diphospho-muramoylpentapeptide beta-N- acetylglucosaminyltransferase [Marinobacter sp. EN3]MBY5938568.1 undecaprenyldiphospho-muramoylpentapeptide beta-N-acetylglucosaminyltransferase [Marinobacter nauticus]MBY5955797.1 undecaprenyldiphospho-muramoylpentapeptide beta-N-acetylglucosaminyltransferase [Marinobacter nauticus]MBY6009588.1 undecaprenyldiphospho-muramoylpentape